jgi:autoinducer 2-degrading protein
MIVTLVHVWVKDEFVNDFIKATIENHQKSIKEPGNLRFDILQDAENPAKFVFYEAFKDEKAVADHKLTAHYQVWRDAVVDWMAEPRKGIKHSVVCPLEESQW